MRKREGRREKGANEKIQHISFGVLKVFQEQNKSENCEEQRAVPTGPPNRGIRENPNLLSLCPLLDLPLILTPLATTWRDSMWGNNNGWLDCWCIETTEPRKQLLTIRSSFFNQQSNADTRGQTGQRLTLYSKTSAAEGHETLPAWNAKFQCKFLPNPLSLQTIDSWVLLYSWVHTVLCMYMQNVHAKYVTQSKKKWGKEPGCSSIEHYSFVQMLLLWLEKTMLAPTCTISSLLILTITVRRTRWSVGRGVLRVVTQAYQGDEETRLTEPRYCWPANLHSSPLLNFTFILKTTLISWLCTARGEASLLSFIW